MAAFQIPRTPHTTNKTIRFPFQFSETIIKIKNRLFISSFVFFGRSLPLCIV